MPLNSRRSVDGVVVQAVDDGGAPFVVDLDGYEGPLQVLLALAESQKVDILQISMTRLADQFLAFVREAGRRRFALAADYLVMAAALTHLKSRLLLPKPEPVSLNEPSAEAVAAALAARLARLAVVRRAARDLEARPILRRDIFTRGDPQATVIVSRIPDDGDLGALLAAYVAPAKRRAERRYAPTPAPCYALDDARLRLRAMAPNLSRWTKLSRVTPAPEEVTQGGRRPAAASCLASTLSATLELVREGVVEARQLTLLDEVYLRGVRRAA
ncbi:MAG: segregation/condensation protein A [Caulobacteraceae bacterium]|nr:segregation/condensation protein A [Caulobacteraceae bacterium]